MPTDHGGRVTAPGRPPSGPRLPRALQEGPLLPEELADEGQLSGRDAAGGDLPGVQVELLAFDQCVLTDVRLAGARLERPTVVDTLLRRCDLANLRAPDAGLARVRLEDCRCTGSAWGGSSWRDVTWDGVRGDLASFRSAAFRTVRFTGCDLREADFHGADLRGASFTECVLDGARFSQARAVGTRFTRCSLVGVDGASGLRGAVVPAADLPDLALSLALALGLVVEGD